MTADVPPMIGGGETGRLVRDTDWSDTPLGAYATWPQSLRSVLSVVLGAKGIAALYWGPEQLLLYNDAYGTALGDRHPRAFGRPMWEALADIAPVLGPQVAEVLRTGEGFAIENMSMTMHRHGRDEETVWTYNYSPVQGETGGFAGVLLLATEMTNHKIAERSEQRGRTRLETALKVARLGTFDWQPYVGLIEMDARASEIFGLPIHGVMSHDDAFACVAPDDLDRLRTDTIAIMGIEHPFDPRDLGRTIDFSYDLVHADGSRRSILSSGAIIENPDGTRRMIGAFNDVTDLKRAEAQLREQNATLEQRVVERTAELNRLWDTSPDLMLIIDFAGMFRRVNPAWTMVLGYGADELVGHHVNEFVIPDDHHETRDAYELAAAGGLPKIENRYRHKDGSVRWISWVAAPAGDVTYATGRDITAEREQAEALREAEEALRQSQKMDAVGQLTGGVAHDFNNLLTVIKSSSDLLKRRDLTEERRARYIDAISNTVDRAAKLTGQLLAFARRQALKPTVFAASDSVRSLADMIGTLTGARVQTTTAFPETSCFVNADASQFDTALVNLAVNARDAMNGEGRITITVEPVETLPAIRAHPTIEAPYVAVSLRDTGSGIATDTIERIFEPFFTTKETGKGTGLGLSQVFGFAKQSGGDITVESTVGEGTMFTLYLPRVAAPEQVAALNEPEALIDGYGTQVLVVEDNADVGSFTVQSLSDLGYSTTLALDGAAALAELAKDAERFDVVFSDVVMPGMSGIELGQEIRRLYHDLPVVLTSGYSHVLAQNGTFGFELLQKPYSVEQLSQMLRKAASWHRRKRLMGQ